ncbi:MAG: hypothetical protein NVSMB55_25270 [Mycobacteriales bacterium]
MSETLSPRRLAAAFLVLAVSGAAAAHAATAASPWPASGTASSTVTLLDLSVGGHPISVGRLVLTSASASGTAGVTGLIVDGTAYGEKTVSTGSASSPSISSGGRLPGAVSRLVTVTAPAASLSAGNGVAHAGTDSLGSVSLLGLPLAIDGSASATTGVDALHAGAAKTLVVRNLALPSIGALLTSLGLDVTKLPASVLTQLVDQLGLVNGTIADAKAKLDAALAPLQPQIAAAQQQLAAAQVAVAAAQASVTTTTASFVNATATLDSATQQLQAALGTPPHLLRTAALTGLPVLASPVPTVSTSPVPTVVASPLPTVSTSPLPTLPTVSTSPLPTVSTVVASPVPTVSTVVASPVPTVSTVVASPLPTNLPALTPPALTVPTLPAVLSPAVQPLVDTYNAAKAAYDTALANANAATAALNVANGALNTVTTTLNTLLSTVAGQTAALVKAITAVLGATPLVSVDSFTVRTEASATSASAGGQTARVVSGQLQGVHVLGTDVLQKALGSDSVDLSFLGAAPTALLNTAIQNVTGTLSSVLSAVPGLSVPAPTVELLSSSASTAIAGGFGTARNTVHALRITVPALTIPTALQAPLAGLSVQALGDLVTSPLSIAVGTLSDAASFRPAVRSTTGTAPAGTPRNVTGGTPTGSTPSATTPTGATPTGATPTGTSPTGTSPTGSSPSSAPPAAGPGQQLPRTGLPAGVAVMALGLTGAGLLLRRRLVND